MSLEQLKQKLKRKPVVKKKESVSLNVKISRRDDLQEQDKDEEEDAPADLEIAEIKKGIDRSQIMRKLKKSGILKVVISKEREDPKESEKDVSDDFILSQPKTSKKTTRKVSIETINRLEDDEDSDDDAVEVPRTRRTTRPIKGVSELPQEEWVDIDNSKVIDRLPEPLSQPELRVSSYYLNNRKKFVNFINSYFSQYRDEMLNDEITLSCDDIGKDENAEFKLLIHQKIVRDYLNLHTPYRGLLLYHGLGSGKTCSSIAIAEGMKSAKKVIVMTPASLRRNYIEEIKKCGDTLFKKEQHWQWISLTKMKNDENLPKIISTLSSAMGLSEEFIKKKKGVWLVDAEKESNLSTLLPAQLVSLDKQIDEMVENKYHFINYNGLRRDKLKSMTNNYENNLFDGSVVIIDEVHNFISRISNKITKEKRPTYDDNGKIEVHPISLALVLYEMLMIAKDVRIVFLTGTPIINYPNELGILYNILRGYIKTWNFDISSTDQYSALKTKIAGIFSKDKFTDYFEFSKKNVLTITRNPFGFETVIKSDSYKGVTGEPKRVKNTDGEGYSLNDRGQISDDDFKKRVLNMLENNGISVNKYKTTVELNKTLPDDLETFSQNFLGEGDQLTNENVFKTRILGLSSYFRSAQEELLPKYNPLTDFQVIKIPMSDYQLGVYEIARSAERKQESQSKKKKPTKTKDGIYEDPKSSYRIFSRLFCNFVMPVPPGRPLPKEDSMDDSYSKAVSEDNKKGSNDLEGENTDEVEGDEIIEKGADSSYNSRIKDAIKFLRENAKNVFSREKLEVYSPKFLHMLENISDPEHKGLHLVYSQFRTLEGIGIFKMMLEYNGYTQFKIKKNISGVWELDILESNRGKPMFALYTGTESAEEKEIIRNVYNSNWDPNLPLTKTLSEIATSNHMGEIIKVLMITASGSEGINLRSTRFVHIMEPYWHPTRKDQVIGRARRICSHKALPEDMQDVRVFMYLMTMTKEQLDTKVSKDMKLKDLSKRMYKATPESERQERQVFTSDEALYEISTIKEKIITGLTRLIKEAAVDCATYSRRGTSEQVQCLTFGEPRVNEMAIYPNIEKQPKDSIIKKNQDKIRWRGQAYEARGKKYIYRKISDTEANLYDVESYYQALEDGNVEPRLVAVEEKRGNDYIIKEV